MSPNDKTSIERPALLDPTEKIDCQLLTFKPNGEVDLSPEYKGKAFAESKFKASVIYLNLNWSAFQEARGDLYARIERIVDRGTRVSPPDVEAYVAAPDSTYSAWKDAIRDLCASLDPREDYAAAARVYVESFRHVWWVKEIVLESSR